MQIYRVLASGRIRLATSFLAGGSGRARWNGRLRSGPTTPGTYLVGLTVTDRACNSGRFPATLPPVSGTATQAEVTVRGAGAGR
jgi:hypothetical protein